MQLPVPPMALQTTGGQWQAFRKREKCSFVIEGWRKTHWPHGTPGVLFTETGLTIRSGKQDFIAIFMKVKHVGLSPAP